MVAQIKDYYSAIENFAKNDRNLTQICTSQELVKDGFSARNCDGNYVVIEHWYDKSNGKNISVIYKTDGTYRINHLN